MTERHGVYGVIPAGLADVPPGAEQFSPLVPGSPALEMVAEESLASIAVLAPPGTLERRYVLALSLRSLRVGGLLVALAPRNRGGTTPARRVGRNSMLRRKRPPARISGSAKACGQSSQRASPRR
ncbi:MAG: hypothetical protein WDM81_02120 [Rhizomicrobium sp.]